MYKYNKVAGYRASIKMSKQDMALSLGITYYMYVKKENNLKEFTLQEKKKLMKIFNEFYPELTADDVFEREVDVRIPQNKKDHLYYLKRKQDKVFTIVHEVIQDSETYHEALNKISAVRKELYPEEILPGDLDKEAIAVVESHMRESRINLKTGKRGMFYTDRVKRMLFEDDI